MIISKFFQVDKKLDYKGFLLLFTILYTSNILALLIGDETGHKRDFLSNHSYCLSILLCLIFYHIFNQINIIYFSHISLLFYSMFTINSLSYYGLYNVIGYDIIGIYNSIIIIFNIILCLLKCCNNFVIVYYQESFNNYIKENI